MKITLCNAVHTEQVEGGYRITILRPKRSRLRDWVSGVYYYRIEQVTAEGSWTPVTGIRSDWAHTFNQALLRSYTALLEHLLIMDCYGEGVDTT